MLLYALDLAGLGSTGEGDEEAVDKAGLETGEDTRVSSAAGVPASGQSTGPNGQKTDDGRPVYRPSALSYKEWVPSPRYGLHSPRQDALCSLELIKVGTLLVSDRLLL